MVLSRLVWLLFVVNLGLAIWTTRSGGWEIDGVVRADGLTAVMWVAVAFFSGIVHSFSRRYMAADERVDRFFGLVFALTLVVMVVTVADHVALFVLAWLSMGLIMADLIGHLRGWPEAHAAGRLARRYFLAGSGLLAAGLAVLALATGETAISEILASVDALSTETTTVAAGLVLGAAMIQSALVPFHGWLLSSMTAPTPASAMMHAGFVNAGGVLLSRLAPVFAGDAAIMLVIVVAGASSALIAQAWMLVKPSAKGRLGCSTVAQMGFMILQCGLGFFAAAVTHLIVHGFYKAYMFLSVGSRVEKVPPKTTKSGAGSTAIRLAVGVVAAIAAGVLFASLTGKSLTGPGTGVFLTAIVVLSALRGTRSVLDQTALSPLARAVGIPLALLPTIAVYAGIYNGISAMMAGLPMIHPHLEMTPIHWLVLGLFVLGHVALEAGWHRESGRLYVALLNSSQPDPATVPTRDK
ncbi:proton-conducting transporter transmembrane domain-containing protein [Natronoarchaeum philippinense]|nr:proton-conducting transporter membrane subunit [Natronoarchaeum philippinense]